MKVSNIHVIIAAAGLWIFAMALVYADAFDINTAVLVSLIIFDIGWTLKVNNDTQDNKMNIALVRQKLEMMHEFKEGDKDD